MMSDSNRPGITPWHNPSRRHKARTDRRAERAPNVGTPFRPIHTLAGKGAPQTTQPIHFNPKLREVLFAASSELIVVFAARPNRAFFFHRPRELDRDPPCKMVIARAREVHFCVCARSNRLDGGFRCRNCPQRLQGVRPLLAPPGRNSDAYRNCATPAIPHPPASQGDHSPIAQKRWPQMPARPQFVCARPAVPRVFPHGPDLQVTLQWWQWDRLYSCFKGSSISAMTFHSRMKRYGERHANLKTVKHDLAKNKKPIGVRIIRH
jgi:hypothetical protein